MCDTCGCNDTGERLRSPAREQLAAEAGAVFGTPPEVETPEPIGETPEFGGLTLDDIEADETGAVLVGDAGQTIDADDPVFEPREGESDEGAHARYHEERDEPSDHEHREDDPETPTFNEATGDFHTAMPYKDNGDTPPAIDPEPREDDPKTTTFNEGTGDFTTPDPSKDAEAK